jgi:hypothetical protein
VESFFCFRSIRAGGDTDELMMDVGSNELLKGKLDVWSSKQADARAAVR